MNLLLEPIFKVVRVIKRPDLYHFWSKIYDKGNEYQKHQRLNYTFYRNETIIIWIIMDGFV